MRSMLMVAVLLLAGGCAFVTSPVIVGETPLNIEAVRSEWEGTWLTADGAPVLVKVLDGTNGVLQVGWSGEDDAGNMKLELVSAYLRTYDDWIFATLAPLDELNEEDPYVWFKIVKDKRMCLIWLPDMDKFQALVDAGILPGEATSGPEGTYESRKETGVKLHALKPEHLALIASETHGVLFAWEAPLVLFKTASGQDPAPVASEQPNEEGNDVLEAVEEQESPNGENVPPVPPPEHINGWQSAAG